MGKERGTAEPEDRRRDQPRHDERFRVGQRAAVRVEHVRVEQMPWIIGDLSGDPRNGPCV